MIYNHNSGIVTFVHATFSLTDKQAFGRAMASANAQGMDGDHIQEVSRTAEGIRFKESQGRGTRAQYHENMRNAGVPVGNQAANVQPLPPKVNQQVKPAQLRAMDKGIQSAGSEADKIFGMFRQSAQMRRAGKVLNKMPLLGGVLMAGGTLLAGGSPGQAFSSFVETENPIENLDAGPVFDERQDYGQVLKEAKEQNAKPLFDRLKEGALGTRAIRGQSGAQKALQSPYHQ